MSSFSKIFQIFSKGFCKSLVFYFSFYLIFSPLFSFQAFAQSLPINPVPNNATLGTSSNNIPVLNITKPTATGVSVNKFNDFNVGTEGLIVNNLNLQDYNITYKSALSNQHVEFNPNFRDGDAAKIILNEVVSNSKTLMNGYTEIYGRKADYIVANPNGITCNGCGFINTTRLSLVTGSSNIVNGNIENFRISPNAELRINGVGVENFAFYSSSPADLVSNAIKISGNILSNSDLRILSGNDKYDWKNQAVSSNSNVNTELAVDVSALGGIKAGNIKIIATQKGFGINLDGDVIADTDNIEITADGEIKVKNLVAQNNIVATSNDKITAIDNGELVSNNLIYFDAGNILLHLKQDLLDLNYRRQNFQRQHH
ncbi:MAG: filamentous hemagglutinin N-terminal domain-containing protein, partial [bacterium]|nr:filamentous hemagglutinin N-terminal domain-containing protein [bacterium]